MRVEEKRKEGEEKRKRAAAEKSIPREVASDDDDAEYYKQEASRHQGQNQPDCGFLGRIGARCAFWRAQRRQETSKNEREQDAKEGMNFFSGLGTLVCVSL